MKVAVIVFPGSNCDRDVAHAVRLCGAEAELVWHERVELGGADAVILPGGFAHGDYLRAGAIARFSPIMAALPQLHASNVHQVRVGRRVELTVEADSADGARATVDALAADFLANPLIERWEIEAMAR